MAGYFRSVTRTSGNERKKASIRTFEFAQNRAILTSNSKADGRFDSALKFVVTTLSATSIAAPSRHNGRSGG